MTYRTKRFKGKTMNYARYLWFTNIGPVAKGYDIHHIDGNRRNDDLSNLMVLLHKTHIRLAMGWKRMGRVWYKRCGVCNQMLPLSAYTRRSKLTETPDNRCKSCSNLYQKRRRHEKSRSY